MAEQGAGGGLVLVGKILRKTLPPMEEPDWIPPLKSKSLPISFSHTEWEIFHKWRFNFSFSKSYVNLSPLTS